MGIGKYIAALRWNLYLINVETVMYSTFMALIVLSLPIAHMGWIITSSGLFRPIREKVTHPFFSEGIHCSICTITQLSLLLAWVLPDVIVTPLLPLSYILKAMLLAKVSCIVYDLGEALGTLPYYPPSEEG